MRMNPPSKPQAFPANTPGELPVRRRPAHGVLLVEGQPTIVFLTCCTKDRRPWLAVPEVQDALFHVWTEATAWLVGRYVLMPDHLHLFAGLAEEAVPFDNWVRYWKPQFTRRHGQPAHRWQSGHWDTRLRTQPVSQAKS